MTNTFHLPLQNAKEFNPFEHPAVLNELNHLLISLLPFTNDNKGWLISQYLRYHSINRILAAANPPLIHNIINGKVKTAATESLFAVNEGNKLFCNDLENYIMMILR
jgi:hypothetical protein